jgi:pimeloyl-ACP methyl ester carboxylesterase
MLKFTFFMSFIMAASAMSAAHAELDADCSASDILQVSVPLDYDQPGAGEFNYRFKFHRGQPGEPVVIVLPGGPGGNLIAGANGKTMLGALPKSYNFVLTDPRGAGCNEDPALNSDRYFRSRFLAQDTLAIVRKLQETEGQPLSYVLYGQSYGTLQATMTASMAASMHVSPPRALVLEGIVGHSFQNFAEYFQGIQEEWRSVRSGVSEEWRRKFKTGVLPLANSKVWALVVEEQMMRGFDPTRGPHLNYLTSGGGTMELLTMVNGIDGASAHGETVLPMNRMATVIGCRELFGDIYMNRDLVDGELVMTGKDFCDGDNSGIQEPFDAALWPVTVPIVYFEGDHDPDTPPAQARYHFESQTQAERYYVRLDRAAHAPLTVSLKIKDCPDRIWQSLTGELTSLPKALNYCDDMQPARITVEIKPPAPGR